MGNLLMNKFQLIRTTLPSENDYSTLGRMQRSMYCGFFENYVIMWSKNNEFFHDYEQNLKKNLIMQSKILNCDLTEEEIDTLISHKVTTLYVGNILETEQARKTLHALKERLDELQKLEKSIEEVHSLFIRLQILIADQGVLTQRIENHFNDSRDHVKVAAQELKQAEKLKNKNRKNKIILIVLGIFAVTSLIIPRKKK
ncbi:syntaxin-4-like [Calliphora vicina]|uniref:syntaxin-4-like n=1 Tax=Calliphora vicina TaxID=7373 RepID=UPI00325C085E